MNTILKKTEKPPCPHFASCGNCALMESSYENQLAYKTSLAANALKDFPQAKVFACEGLYYPYKYRNKLTLAFADYRGNVNIGFYQAESKDVVNVKNCLLHEGWYGVVVEAVREFAGKFKIDIYNPDTFFGALRYVVCRYVGGALLVTVVSARRKLIGLAWLFKRLKEHFKNVAVYLNVNSSLYNNVFGDEFVFIAGEKNLRGQYLGMTVELKPRMFLQTNEKIAARIFKQVADEVKSTDEKSIVDAYCGVGLTSLLFAKSGLQVTGIEREEQSVNEAIRLARMNKLDVEFLQGDAETLFPEALSHGAQTVFVDPPRKGLGEAAAPLLAAAPPKILYLSCSPDSLKADLDLLKEKYIAVWARPYDMFPQTRHVETLVCLTRKN